MDEAQIRVSLQISKDDANGILNYRSYPTDFAATVTGAMGPSPGAIVVYPYGTDVSLAALGTPGLCRLTNQDATNWVSYGIYDPISTHYLPLGELLPGEMFVLRLSRELGYEYPGTGTGTFTAGTTNLRFRSNNAAVKVLVEAFSA